MVAPTIAPPMVSTRPTLPDIHSTCKPIGHALDRLVCSPNGTQKSMCGVPPLPWPGPTYAHRTAANQPIRSVGRAGRPRQCQPQTENVDARRSAADTNPTHGRPAKSRAFLTRMMPQTIERAHRQVRIDCRWRQTHGWIHQVDASTTRTLRVADKWPSTNHTKRERRKEGGAVKHITQATR